MSSSNGWKSAARRGEFSVILMTVRRARIIGAPVHADAVVVAELRPDDGPAFCVSFAGMDRLRAFVAEMQPRGLTVECAPEEDGAELFSLAVSWAEGVQGRLRAGATVH